MRLALKILVGPLRKIDRRFADRPDYVISNSTYIAREIKKYYNRDSVIIFPPVETEIYKKQACRKREGFIVTSRQVPWKRIDLAVRACLALGEKLVVVNEGSEHERLVELAANDPGITFEPAIQDPSVIAKKVGSAKGFIFPSLEPFGIAPIEALAAGTPVIAYGKGGALDYVHDGKNGILFRQQTVSSLKQAIERFNKTQFNSNRVVDSAEQFSDANFKRHMIEYLKQCVKNRDEEL
jgi:glycosyltransferase involved in cell wall biosynthesis